MMMMMMIFQAVRIIPSTGVANNSWTKSENLDKTW
jgi:hypothetical protein